MLFECASGYGVFEVVESDDIGKLLPKVQDSVTDRAKFSEFVKMKGFMPFTSPEDALKNMMAVSEGQVEDALKNYLELTLPKCSKLSSGLMRSSTFVVNISWICRFLTSPAWNSNSL